MSEERAIPRIRRGPAIGAGLIAAALAIATPLIVQMEGRINRGYLDPIGVATSCVGHTGRDVVVGRRYSDAECDSQLAHDLQRTANGLAPCITVAVAPETFAALTSWAFNVGTAAACRSTVIRRLNAGNLRGACDGLLAWTYAGGRQLPGLVRRRHAERQLCLRGL